MPTAATVAVEIHNVAGARVAVLEHGLRAAGTHRLAWHGVDDAGRSVPSGVYLCRIEADGAVASRSLLLVK